MEAMKYWQKQGRKQLFDGLDLERPEQKGQAGRLLVVGGSKGVFFAVANVVEKARKLNVGTVKVLLPDSLKATLPRDEDMIFAPSEASGGFGKGALNMALAAANDADYVLMVGDLGRNAETAAWLGEFLKKNETPVMLTRDAVDLAAADAADWLMRENVSICASLSQMQKIFRAVYYPKMVTLSMPVNQLVETLHKFTITYPVLVITLHGGQIVTAMAGEVVTTSLSDTEYTPINLWSGDLVAKFAAFSMWNLGKRFEVAVSTLLN